MADEPIPATPWGIHPSLFAMDLNLIDQLIRGRVPHSATILDAGCGGGRNLTYFFERGDVICATDRDPDAVALLRERAEGYGDRAASDHFRVESIEATSFEPSSFDLVICNAVLHFANDHDHFSRMVEALHTVLRPGGLFFARFATTKTIESVIVPITHRRPTEDRASDHPTPRPLKGWHALPDGSDRFLVDLEFLYRESERLDVELADPIKTVNVHDLRSMTTWVWWKR